MITPNKSFACIFTILLFGLASALHAIPLADLLKSNVPQIINGTLNLEFKDLTDIEGIESIPGIHQVKRLRLGHNQLQRLPDSFGNLVHLQSLDLTFNQLKVLPDTLGNLAQLEYLQVESNGLQSLPDVFDTLPRLRTINLSYNQLQNLPDSICNLAHLQNLYLHKNQLTRLPKNFDALVELRFLDLTFNCIPGTTTDIKTKYFSKPEFNHLVLKFKPEKIESSEKNLIAAIKAKKVATVTMLARSVSRTKYFFDDRYFVRGYLWGTTLGSLRDERGNTPLHIAALYGERDPKKKIFTTLLGFSENPAEALNIKNQEGFTPLMIAVIHDPQILPVISKILAQRRSNPPRQARFKYSQCKKQRTQV